METVSLGKSFEVLFYYKKAEERNSGLREIRNNRRYLFPLKSNKEGNIYNKEQRGKGCGSNVFEKTRGNGIQCIDESVGLRSLQGQFNNCKMKDTICECRFVLNVDLGRKE